MKESKGRKKSVKPKSNHYVNNKEFLQLIIEYKASGDKKAYEKIGRIVLKIAEHSIMAPNFINYTGDRKVEMVSDACYFMIRFSIKNFDPEKSDNPFAYFSQTAKNAFLQYINKSKKRESVFSSLAYIDLLEDSDQGEIEHD